MKKLLPHITIKPLTVTVILATLFFFGNSLKPTEAQVAGGGTVPYPFQNPTVDTNNLCEPAMQDFASKELADFRNYLDTNFQNKSSTGSLIELALGKYREMRDELHTAYTKYYPNFGSMQLTTGIQPDKCQQIINQTLDDAKVLLKNHAVSTSGVKKSTALLEKYQQINAELANLFQQFIYMKAYLDTFAGKMPCYPKSGCVKG
jgi:hypothetical protein